MRVLVTGAGGFVGQHLCRQLVLRGVATKAAVRSKHCLDLPQQVDVIEGCDLGSDANWPEALANVDCVVHCAARAHIMKDHVADPLAEFRRVNVDGTRRIARMAVTAKVRRMIFISTVKVLGESTTGRPPFTELAPACPEDCYGQSKLEAERLLANLAAQTGLELVTVRCPLIYGPGVKGNFESLLRLADSPWPLPLAGISNVRSLLYVGNLVDFVYRLMKAEALKDETYLVSDGEGVSTTSLVQYLRQELGRPERLFRAPWTELSVLARWAGREAQVSRLIGSLQLDISKSGRDLGWSPPYTTPEGLKLTVSPELRR